MNVFILPFAPAPPVWILATMNKEPHWSLIVALSIVLLIMLVLTIDIIANFKFSDWISRHIK